MLLHPPASRSKGHGLLIMAGGGGELEFMGLHTQLCPPIPWQYFNSIYISTAQSIGS